MDTRKPRRSFFFAAFLACLGSLPACSNLASLGVGLTLDPLGVQVTIRTTAEQATYTIVTPPGSAVPPATQPVVIPVTLTGDQPIVVAP